MKGKLLDGSQAHPMLSLTVFTETNKHISEDVEGLF